MASFTKFGDHGCPSDEWTHRKIEPEPATTAFGILRYPFTFLCLPRILIPHLTASETSAGRALEIHVGQEQDLQMSAQWTPGMIPLPARFLIQFRDPALIFLHRAADVDRFRRIAVR